MQYVQDYGASTCKVVTLWMSASGSNPPAVWMSASDSEPPALPSVPPSPGAAANGAARLLIVEDDWLIANDIKELVSGAGYAVVAVASSADEAVAAAVAERPDLVLMDIRLLGAKDGIDAALEIRRKADRPCLMVTAHLDDRLLARAAPARPRGWVQKPFASAQLLAAVAAALDDNHPDQ